MQFEQSKRSDIILLGGDGRCLAGSQSAQQSAMPVVGFLNSDFGAMLNGVGEHLKAGPLYQVERLSADYNYWNQFFQYLTSIETNFPEQAFRHEQQCCYGIAQWQFYRGGPTGIWPLLSPERQALMRGLLSSDARGIYEGFG